MVICELKPELLAKMSEYRGKETVRTTSPVAFRGAAPASPRKFSTRKESPAFPGFSMNLGFDSKMDQLFGRADMPYSEGTVEREFDRYQSSKPSIRETDILHFWAVSFRYTWGWTLPIQMIQVNRNEFPTLFAIAMDYLPIQASSVPCERVFSSAKETDTLKRNRIHPMLMEALQMMKFSLKKDRQSISFTDGWKTAMAEMTGVQKATGKDLLAQLLTGDRQTTTDALLKVFDEEVEDDDN
jgi:hypothetical protein